MWLLISYEIARPIITGSTVRLNGISLGIVTSLLVFGVCKSREIGKKDIKAEMIQVRVIAMGTDFLVIHLVY